MTETEHAHESTVNPIFRFGAPLLAVVIVLSAFFFLDQPFVNIGSQDSPAPHWAVMIYPLTDPNFVHDVWFGVDLPQASVTGERFIAFGIGALFITSLFFLGRVLFHPFKKSLAINKAEEFFFSGILGFIFLSFALTLAGLGRHANIPLLPETLVAVFLGVVFLLIIRLNKFRKTASTSHESTAQRSSVIRKISIVQLLLLILFSSFYICASTQPLFEYDALEYHAQGAREIFESGSIRFSSNNVYLNMPLGVEMFYVAGLDLARDVGYRGADVLRIGLLVGKTILTSVALLTAFGLLCFCGRFFKSVKSGVWCAIVFLSFPNLFEVYSNGLNDAVLGLTLFTIFYAFLLFFTESDDQTSRSRWLFAIFTGIVAGFSATVKYTGVIFVCIPTFVALTILSLCPQIASCLMGADTNKEIVAQSPKASKLGPVVISLVAFVLATAVVSGGWYAKNYFATGNPVYPLAYKVFGDSTKQWNEAIDARWNHAHSSSDFSGKQMCDSIVRTLWKEDYNSPFFLFVPLAGILTLLNVFLNQKTDKDARQSFMILTIFGLVLAFWTSWFLLTHRLTRFLIPVSPLAALIIGLGIDRSLRFPSRILKIAVVATTLLLLCYSGLLIDLLGQGRLAPLRALEQDPARFSETALFFNHHPETLKSVSDLETPDQKLLLVGDAKACAFHVPVAYSTCWNDSPLMPLIEPGIERDSEGKIVRIINPTKIQDALANAKISFICVDLNELARFRSEGNYGFNNPEIDANLFILLMESGIIEPFSPEELKNAEAFSHVFKVLPVAKE